ncbi:MAG: hypothetical protein WC966_00095 [Bradymonadales bacterium]|jgi:hypothetical protein
MLNAALVYNSALGLRMDWKRKLQAVLCHNTDAWSIKSIQAIIDFQREHPKQLNANGLLCPKTRLLLEERFPVLAETLLGPNLSARVIAKLDSASLYNDARATILASSALFWDLPMQAQLLGIRGAKVQNGYIVQGQEALMAQRALDAGTASDYFSSYGKGFCDCVILCYLDKNSRPHAKAYNAALSPNIAWPQGTAHLRDGQYFYQLGLHRTREIRHMQAIIEYDALSSQAPLIFEQNAESVQYRALNAVSEIEVIRSEAGELALSLIDYERSRRAIAERDPRYTSARAIGINIHSCPESHASSQGCQNIPVPQYGDFIAELDRILKAHPLKSQALIPYTLIEASKINAVPSSPFV